MAAVNDEQLMQFEAAVERLCNAMSDFTVAADKVAQAANTIHHASSSIANSALLMSRSS